MARLIVKSPYIQCGKQNAGSYLRYIATRERVEIIPDDRPPTRKQEQLIAKLTKDFPDVKDCWSTRTTQHIPQRLMHRHSSRWRWRNTGSRCSRRMAT